MIYISDERVTNLNDLITNKCQENQIVKTSKDKEISCDLVIPCTGTKINNNFYKEELGILAVNLRLVCLRNWQWRGNYFWTGGTETETPK